MYAAGDTHQICPYCGMSEERVSVACMEWGRRGGGGGCV